MKNDPITLSSYRHYYLALSGWVNKNISKIDPDILKKNRITGLLNIDIDDYLIDNPEICLTMETKRLFDRKPDTLYTLVMGISNTLWDLVMQYTNIDCPICENEMHYYFIVTKDAKKKKLVLECDVCGYGQFLDGTKIDEHADVILPVSKNDLHMHGIVTQ